MVVEVEVGVVLVLVVGCGGGHILDMIHKFATR